MKAHILTIDPHKESRDTIRAILAPDGFTMHEAQDAHTAFEQLNTISPDIILMDFAVNGKNGLELASEIRERLPLVPIIMITASRDNRVVVEAMRRGIYDYLTKPVNANDLRLAISQGLEEKRLKDEVQNLRSRLKDRDSLLTSMGRGDKVQKLVRLLEKIAPTSFTVLIEGESGAGKELVARAIHNLSLVSDGPFVAVDCGAIPETLFESELFGYTKGAFTGAVGNKTGFLEAADKGTLFLDEVCNLSYTAQQKLLRAIEERRVQPLGTTVSRPVDVRIVAASNRPLEADVEARTFRVDLLYRLKEVSVQVPPLREREEDIPYLAQRFLDELRGQLGLLSPGFSPQAMARLMRYAWPGNVRELRNVVRQAALMCEGGELVKPEYLPFAAESVAEHQPTAKAQTSVAGYDAALDQAVRLALEEPEAAFNLGERVRKHAEAFEKALITAVLRAHGNNKMQASKYLQVDYKTLYRKLKHYGMQA